MKTSARQQLAEKVERYMNSALSPHRQKDKRNLQKSVFEIPQAPFAFDFESE